MEYSPIESIRVKNFNCIGDIEMSFKESPIIAIYGDNDAGKSSFIDGFACLTYHANERNQKDNIRDGTQGFGIETKLEDGTTIIRTKTARLNRFEVLYPNGTKWSADKIEAGAGVPKAVQDVMGCIKEEETKEFLHIRTYRDQVLFINTTAGTNYKVMYGALKAEHISKAIAKGNAELNALRNAKNDSELILDTLMSQYNSIKVYDTSTLIAVRDRIKKHYNAIALLEETMALKKRLDALKEEQRKYEVLKTKQVQELDVPLIDKLVSASKILSNYKALQLQDRIYKPSLKCEMIETAAIVKLKDTIKLKDTLESSQNQNQIYRQVEKCEPINTDVVLQLETSIRNKKQLVELQDQAKVYKQLEKLPETDATILNGLIELRQLYQRWCTEKETYDSLEKRKDDLTQAIEASGVKMATCNQCGNLVYVE